ncbi:MAG: DUF2490 domain-containing protein [Lewinella sp.]|uniref:DUF2490 domain-containing protein n=1 Tax=Lewinella sp. TaxID=2004506 RepID=UPI003D6B1BE6
MKKYFLFLLMSGLVFFSLNAQTVTQLNSWWTYSGNHRISEKFSLHTLYSFRRNDFVKNWQQSLLRLGVNYHYSGKLTGTLGYDDVINYPYGEQPIAHRTKERRLYEQVSLKDKVGVVGITQTYRLEQRFVSRQNTRNRVRCRLALEVPLQQADKNKLFLSLFNEIFINVGQAADNHYFDQNWIYGGLGYRLNKNSAVNVGYMNQYLVKTDNVHIENNHTLQVGLSYSFDLRYH